MKIALFGGSFDPPHLGHQAVIQWLLEEGNFDEVWILPSFSHPFQKPLSDFNDRLTLCKLAFEQDENQVKVLEIEKEFAPGPVYSIDVVQKLREQFPQTQFSFVIGSDLKIRLNEWKDIETLKRWVDFIFIPRSGFETSPFPKISSTDLRRLFQEKPIPLKKISSLVPEKVLQYILSQGLYT
ncbi:MAG: nicotinate-nicotinamide nucleotide adenylyltransferase [Deltaproteobacteria bacterium]|nr:nicotinate-nicotinamide nucleotide adenylyltransferase [Deltaproteobacteria bacterium]